MTFDFKMSAGRSLKGFPKLKDLFRENFLWVIFLGPLGDAKIEKKLDPNPLGDPCLCCQSLVRSASSFTSRERNLPKKGIFL